MVTQPCHREHAHRAMRRDLFRLSKGTWRRIPLLERSQGRCHSIGRIVGWIHKNTLARAISVVDVYDVEEWRITRIAGQSSLSAVNLERLKYYRHSRQNRNDDREALRSLWIFEPPR